ncbi:MAG: UDP-N-acetylglucosamine--N-acetylmuramyl-(pentapeptide) pyrophosphoryl-undecaprenol N-acetylglucosamine transferase, partial [Boseongicola sp.]|nr:UDP-N-acetylglucosamine--N-acetylmuramyl-(pentapeptide) pyrophosphoryl-undecaprenol N-acetylglucosamine transferase [Boseongicola sp.]
YIFAGGGSAGHALPGIRIAETMRGQGHKVVFVGSRASIEERLCAHHGVPFHSVTTGRLSRARKLSIFGAAFRTLQGTFQARTVMRRIRPDGVFSSGGFASVPVVLAAHSLGVRPIVMHACDLGLGLANRMCLPFSTHLTCTFADTCNAFPKGTFVGPIVDPEILTRDDDAAPRKGKPRLLVYGGSLGAAAINDKLRRSLPELLPDFDVFHVCGQGRLDPGLDGLGGYEQHEYVMAFSDVLKASDIAVCRAGSGSLWELVLTGTPHLAVPLPLSVSRGDQIENCRKFETLGTTRWMDQDTFQAAALAPALMEVWDERDTTLAAMRAVAPERPAAQAVSCILQGPVHAGRH